MVASPDVAVRPIFPEDLQEEEQVFMELATVLIEKVVKVDDGLRDGRTTHWIEDFGMFLKGIHKFEELAGDEAFDERVIMPLMEMWDENDGKAPGRFEGRLGTHLDVELKGSEYELRIYGVNRI